MELGETRDRRDQVDDAIPGTGQVIARTLKSSKSPSGCSSYSLLDRHCPKNPFSTLNLYSTPYVTNYSKVPSSNLF